MALLPEGNRILFFLSLRPYLIHLRLAVYDLLSTTCCLRLAVLCLFWLWRNGASRLVTADLGATFTTDFGGLWWSGFCNRADTTTVWTKEFASMGRPWASFGVASLLLQHFLGLSEDVDGRQFHQAGSFLKEISAIGRTICRTFFTIDKPLLEDERVQKSLCSGASISDSAEEDLPTVAPRNRALRSMLVGWANA